LTSPARQRLVEINPVGPEPPREQDTDARPAIADPLPSIDKYDTVLLASPIWNVRAPMIMATFAERYDFAGKTVHPVTTYAMSGLGTGGGALGRRRQRRVAAPSGSGRRPSASGQVNSGG